MEEPAVTLLATTAAHAQTHIVGVTVMVCARNSVALHIYIYVLFEPYVSYLGSYFGARVQLSSYVLGY